jgi:hypothetical protein
MPTLSQIKQVSEVETRFTVTGEDQARRAMEGVAGAQEKVARASETTATVTEQSTRRQLNAASLLDRERKRFDADYRQMQMLQKAAGTFDRSMSQGLIDQTERDRLYGLASAKLAPKTNDNDPTRRGLSSYDKSFIRYQGFDVASTLGSGGSLTTAAFQQGPQLLQQLADRDGGLKAGLKELGVSALGLVTPFTVGATAVAGLGIAFGVAATQASREREMLEKATLGVGAATGATVSQLDALARSSAEGSKVSTSAAREYVATYASLGTLAVPVIGELTRLTSEYARVTGQDGAAAATELGRAVSDGGAALDAVAGKLGGLDDRTRQLIETQSEQGDRSGAQASAAEYLKGTIDANTAATAGWAGAWNLAAKVADGYWESAKRIAGIKLGIVPEGAAEAVVGRSRADQRPP